MPYASLSSDELVAICSQSHDPEAWREFVSRFHPVIATTALRVARIWAKPSKELVDDLVQETYVKICSQQRRVLREFIPRHEDSIFGYLKVLTTNVVHDHFKALNCNKRGGKAHPTENADMELLAMNSDQNSEACLHRKILLDELERTLKNCVAPENYAQTRTIFWLYFRAGLTARAIASMSVFGLSTKGVESTILRITRDLRNTLATRGTGSEVISATQQSTLKGS
jgi:RNA polymerase sigma-70 factor (ECF subfamily)